MIPIIKSDELNSLAVDSNDLYEFLFENKNLSDEKYLLTIDAAIRICKKHNTPRSSILIDYLLSVHEDNLISSEAVSSVMGMSDDEMQEYMTRFIKLEELQFGLMLDINDFVGVEMSISDISNKLNVPLSLVLDEISFHKLSGDSFKGYDLLHIVTGLSPSLMSQIVKYLGEDKSAEIFKECFGIDFDQLKSVHKSTGAIN